MEDSTNFPVIKAVSNHFKKAINGDMARTENWTNRNDFNLSSLVGRTEQLSNHFLMDLEAIRNFIEQLKITIPIER